MSTTDFVAGDLPDGAVMARRRGRWGSAFTRNSAAEAMAETTYRYVRVAVVTLIIAIGAAVVLQTATQGELLSSVSAYYYTPAQSIFVGGLIGMGVAMVALKGTTDFEDIALNIGGMLAPVIAVVPTAKPTELTAAAATTVTPFAKAAPLNVQNNMASFFIAGGLALLAATLIWLIGRLRKVPPEHQNTGHQNTLAPWGFILAWIVFLLAVVVFKAAPDWFVGHAHYCSAIGLFVAALAVVTANGIRKNHAAQNPDTLRALAGKQGKVYFYLAVAMLAAAVVFGILVFWSHTVSLFWLEAVLFAIFGAFWIVQTKERWRVGTHRSAE
jgi:hypothetical protein